MKADARSRRSPNPKGDVVLETLIFMNNGSYASFKNGEQVGPEQGNAWLEVLQAKLDRGMIGPKTEVMMPGWWTPDHSESRWTVEELIKTGHLKAHQSAKR